MVDFGLSGLGIVQESDGSSGRSAVRYNCLKFLLLAKWTSLYIITGSKACWKEVAGPVHLSGDCLLHSSPQCMAVEPARTLSFGVFQLNLSSLRLCNLKGSAALPRLFCLENWWRGFFRICEDLSHGLWTSALKICIGHCVDCEC